MTDKDIVEVVRKLVGEVRPIGEHEVDAERFENLKTLTQVANTLLGDIAMVRPYRKNSAASQKKAGEYAQKFLIDHLGLEE